MFEGKMLRGATGTPMRSIDLAKRRFAEAEPEPLTLANFTTKSLTRAMGVTFIGAPSIRRRGRHRPRLLDRRRAAVLVAGLRRLEEEFLHVPGAGWTTLGAEPTVQADVLVLDHHAAGFQSAREIQILGEVARRRSQASAQLLLLAVGRKGDAIHRTDVHAGIALDAQLWREHRLHIAVETALRFSVGLRRIEAELYLDLDVLERDHL